MKLDLRRPEARATVATIVSLAWPTIIEQVMQTAVQYIDTAMVGSIGTHATAAIGVCTSTIMLLMGVMNIAGIGFSVMVARRIGEGNMEEARTTIRQAMLSILIIGLFFVRPFVHVQVGAGTLSAQYGVDYLTIVCIGSLGIFV